MENYKKRIRVRKGSVVIKTIIFIKRILFLCSVNTFWEKEKKFKNKEAIKIAFPLMQIKHKNIWPGMFYDIDAYIEILYDFS